LLSINNGIVLYKQTVQEGYFLRKKYTCDRFLMADFLENHKKPLKWNKKPFLKKKGQVEKEI
jgi:hypothetical protein